MVKILDSPLMSSILHSQFNTSEENSSFLHLNPRRNADIDYFFAAKVVALITRNLSETCLMLHLQINHPMLYMSFSLSILDILLVKM